MLVSLIFGVAFEQPAGSNLRNAVTTSVVGLSLAPGHYLSQDMKICKDRPFTDIQIGETMRRLEGRLMGCSSLRNSHGMDAWKPACKPAAGVSSAPLMLKPPRTLRAVKSNCLDAQRDRVQRCVTPAFVQKCRAAGAGWTVKHLCQATGVLPAQVCHPSTVAVCHVFSIRPDLQKPPSCFSHRLRHRRDNCLRSKVCQVYKISKLASAE